jgi:hypothetical protein
MTVSRAVEALKIRIHTHADEIIKTVEDNRSKIESHRRFSGLGY